MINSSKLMSFSGMWKIITLTNGNNGHKPTPLYSGIYDNGLIEPNDFVDNPKYNYGLVPNEGYVVLDIDDTYESDILYTHLKQEGLKFNCMKTTRGKHFWFKINRIINNNVNYKNALNINVDIRCGGKKSYLGVKKGVYRDWIEWNGLDIDYIPNYLLPIDNLKKIDLINSVNTQDNLVLWVKELVANNTPALYIEKCLNFINDKFLNNAHSEYIKFLLDRLPSHCESERIESIVIMLNGVKTKITYTINQINNMKRIISYENIKN